MTLDKHNEIKMVYNYLESITKEFPKMDFIHLHDLFLQVKHSVGILAGFTWLLIV